jgi:hypothetical protein
MACISVVRASSNDHQSVAYVAAMGCFRQLSCGHFGKNFFRYSGGGKLFVVSSGKARAYNLTRPSWPHW